MSLTPLAEYEAWLVKTGQVQQDNSKSLASLDEKISSYGMGQSTESKSAHILVNAERLFRDVKVDKEIAAAWLKDDLGHGPHYKEMNIGALTQGLQRPTFQDLMAGHEARVQASEAQSKDSNKNGSHPVECHSKPKAVDETDRSKGR